MRKPALILTLLLGCATQAPGEQRPAPVTAPTLQVHSPHVEVECIGEQPCPAFVGVMVPDPSIYDEQCTGTLVAERLFLTAGHCLRPSARSVGADCGGHRIYFPSAVGENPATAQCDEVIAIALSNTGSITGPDFALVTLSDSSPRPHAPLRAEPPSPGDDVQIWGLIRTAPQRYELRRQSCRGMSPQQAAAQLGPSAHDATWLERCSIFPGHSGAPVFDADGRLRGLVHAGSELFFAIGVMTRLPEVLITLHQPEGRQAVEPL